MAKVLECVVVEPWISGSKMMWLPVAGVWVRPYCPVDGSYESGHFTDSRGYFRKSGLPDKVWVARIFVSQDHPDAIAITIPQDHPYTHPHSFLYPIGRDDHHPEDHYWEHHTEGRQALSLDLIAGTLHETALRDIADIKGDLIVALGDSTVTRLPVGADGQFLVADSVEASNLKYKALEESDLPAHSPKHKHGGDDEVATATPGANAIPKAGADSLLDRNWLPTMIGADGAAGSKGAVPAPAAGDAAAGKYLKADATWAVPAGGGAVAIEEDDVQKVATASVIDFGSGFDVAESPAGEANITLDIDESPLTGLAKLAGRADGQTLRGGTGALENLTLGSTADAVKGGIIVPAGDCLEFIDAVTTPGTPAAGRTRLYGKGESLYAKVRGAGLGVEFVLGSAMGLIYGLGQYGGFAPPSDGVTWSEGFWGLLRGPTATGTPSLAMSSTGRRIVWTTGTVSGDDAGFSTGLVAERDALPYFLIALALAQTTNCRMFVGWTDQTLATMLGADDPAGNYIGLQYSTPRGDTTFALVRKNGTTQTKTNLVAVDTAVHYFRLLNPANSAWIYELMSGALGAQSSGSVVSGQGPGATTQLRFVAGIETETASAAVLWTQNGFVTLNK